jgi:hypothetical protein
MRMLTITALLLFGTGFLVSSYHRDHFRDVKPQNFSNRHPIFYDMLCLDGTYLQQQV